MAAEVELSVDQLLRLDREHVWHPYAAMPNTLPIFPVRSAQGVYLELEDGRRLVDGMSSWWTCIHGYRHPTLLEAAHRQLEKTAHVMFGGITHRPAVELVRRLVELTPRALQKVFLADSGSVAVEVAMKMAVQYWISRGDPSKHRFLTIRSGYYGDTSQPMSVCDPQTGMHHMFDQFLAPQFFADAPQVGFGAEWREDDITSFAQLLEQHHQEIAAAILEPVVQGAGGMRFYSPQYVKRAKELCEKYDVLLILDEIATGFGRTGRLFASEYADVCPDILCVGKAMTGGMVTLAATITTSAMSETFARGEAGVFMHGPTFMGNPLACAISAANIDLLLSYDWQQRIADIEQQLRRELEPCRELSGVRDVRCLGAIGVVELEKPVDMSLLQPAIVEKGVWLRPFGHLLYTMPPYIIEPDELRRITAAMYEVLSG